MIVAILDPLPDGSIHLPLPEELRHGKVKVVATLSPAETLRPRPKAGSLKGFWTSPDFDEPLEEFKDYVE
ncbi:DUF2281 domain-containing protein [Candidatus Sumerlaeota bacterium]|nr:DUF2281 domain-containing protein [Candidatus Sumerlaeota bacterium]